MNHHLYSTESIQQTMRERGECTIRQWMDRGYTPSAACIIKRFGTWDRAWALAMATADDPMWTRSQRRVITSIRKAGRYMTHEEWKKQPNAPSEAMMIRAFGSWRAAWEASGIGMRHHAMDDPSTHPRFGELTVREQCILTGRYQGRSLESLGCDWSITRERTRQIEAHAMQRLEGAENLVEKRKREIKEAVLSVGQYYSQSEWRQRGLYPTPQTILKYFPSWPVVFEEANIPVAKKRNPYDYRAFYTLSEEEQSILEAFYRGKTLKDIAAERDLPETTLEGRFRYAWRKIIPTQVSTRL